MFTEARSVPIAPRCLDHREFLARMMVMRTGTYSGEADLCRQTTTGIVLSLGELGLRVSRKYDSVQNAIGME